MRGPASHVYDELNNKAAGFVFYGSAGGARAVEHLRGILSEMQVAHVRNAVTMSLFTDFENFSVFAPTVPAAGSVQPMLDQLATWTKAMELVRAGEFAPVGTNA